MSEVHWERHPLIARSERARSWLRIQADLGRAQNTVDAYGRALEDYLAFCESREIVADDATKEHVAAWVRDLSERPNPRGNAIELLNSGAKGFSNATLQQRLTAVRLFHDYLMEEGYREDNPVGRGRYTLGTAFGGSRDRGLVPRFRKQPWIPSDEQWRAVLGVARGEPLRNRLLLALSYDAGLRREEACSLRTDDVDPARRLLRIRAEATKGRQGRTVPYSAATGELYVAYLDHRRGLSRARGPLFLSESRRNLAKPITIWTWAKVMRRIALKAEVPRFTTHTLRHLCLTDLARAGWDIHDIAAFAGHRSTQTTLTYIHLSGRDLARKLEGAMAGIHAWRAEMTAEALR